MSNIEVKLDPNAVVDALGNELGCLMKQAVVTALQNAELQRMLQLALAENEGLRARVLAQDADIKALRDQVAPPNHPSKRRRKESTNGTHPTTHHPV